jgi:hypothetical protein
MLNQSNKSTVRQERSKRKLSARIVAAANTILWECPVGRSTTVTSIVICNSSSSQVTFRLFHVTPAESASATTALFYDIILRPATTTVLEQKIYMNSGERLIGYASTASVIGVSLFGEDA